MASAPPIPASANFDDRRSFPRIEVALPAFLHVGGERHPVQIVDMSLGGARISGSVRLPVGTIAILDCGTTGRSALVRWNREQQMGLQFDPELDPREFAVQVQRSKALGAWMRARKEAVPNSVK